MTRRAPGCLTGTAPQAAAAVDSTGDLRITGSDDWSMLTALTSVARAENRGRGDVPSRPVTGPAS